MSWATRQEAERRQREDRAESQRQAVERRIRWAPGPTLEELVGRLRMAGVFVGAVDQVVGAVVRELADRGRAHERDGRWYLGPRPTGGDDPRGSCTGGASDAPGGGAAAPDPGSPREPDPAEQPAGERAVIPLAPTVPPSPERARAEELPPSTPTPTPPEESPVPEHPPHRTTVTAADVEAAVAARPGITYRELARRLGCSDTHLSGLVRTGGRAGGERPRVREDRHGLTSRTAPWHLYPLDDPSPPSPPPPGDSGRLGVSGGDLVEPPTDVAGAVVAGAVLELDAANERVRLLEAERDELRAQKARDGRDWVRLREAILRANNAHGLRLHEGCQDDELVTWLDDLATRRPLLERCEASSRRTLEDALGGNEVVYALTLGSLVEQAATVIVELRDRAERYLASNRLLEGELAEHRRTVEADVHHLVAQIDLLDELRDRCAGSGLRVPLSGGLTAFVAYLTGWLEAHGLITAPSRSRPRQRPLRARGSSPVLSVPRDFDAPEAP